MCCKGSCALSTLIVILLILSFVLDISGCFSSMWYLIGGTQTVLYSEIGVVFYGGIWSDCVSSQFFTTCESKETDWLKAVRAFSVSGFLLYFVAVVVVIVQLCSKPKKKALYIISVCLMFAGAICAMIAFVVYVIQATGKAREFFVGFYITITAFVFGILAGILESVNLVKANSGKVEIN
ncbi:hypothetical protein CHS0354_039759 [Potamilus streckersoni]|uniref:Uncharacterized protein n=1 Tax=Potamilus streckersoni TaxID=2493646 RepID=A0AAE0VLV9_9BIVA|nr:hypothetical protein CHS0354_039759 [Potamilus streckersoni]